MKQYDLVIQLGSQVMFRDRRLSLLEEEELVRTKQLVAGYELATHTEMRTRASAVVIKKGVASRLLISGGSNFGVRYNERELLKPPIFTFDTFADSDYKYKSEAAVIKTFLVEKYGIESNKILAESLSSTTEENAEFVKIILRRRPMFTGTEKIAILTLLYHMERALPVFHKAGLDVEPLFAENVLADNDAKEIDRICTYYSTPKSGKQYPVDHICQLLTEGKSLEELITPWWCISVIDDYVCADGTPEELEKTHTYFAQATTKDGAAAKLREEERLTVPDLENFIKGPFETLEQARKA